MKIPDFSPFLMEDIRKISFYRILNIISNIHKACLMKKQKLKTCFLKQEDSWNWWGSKVQIPIWVIFDSVSREDLLNLNKYEKNISLFVNYKSTLNRKVLTIITFILLEKMDFPLIYFENQTAYYLKYLVFPKVFFRIFFKFSIILF